VRTIADESDFIYTEWAMSKEQHRSTQLCECARVRLMDGSTMSGITVVE
jgi:hypothetical protein